MKFGSIPVAQAEGKILAHNIAGREGQRSFRKGKAITAEDITTLLSDGYHSVYAAELEPGDVDENSAARHIAEAAAGDGLRISGRTQGRVNLVVALSKGVLQVDEARLAQVNDCEGVTFATLRHYSIVSAGQNVATVKIIPYAIPAVTLEHARLAAAGLYPQSSPALIQVAAFKLRHVGLIYTGSTAAQKRVIRSFDLALRNRIEAFEAQVRSADYVRLKGENDDDALAGQLNRHIDQGAEIIILAGETSTMDRNDTIPRAVYCAGGQVTCVGAPIEPGNLVTLAYIGDVPVFGAPGCIRSPKPTIVDQILAALLAGLHLTRSEISALGYGGLIEDGPHGI